MIDRPVGSPLTMFINGPDLGADDAMIRVRIQKRHLPGEALGQGDVIAIPSARYRPRAPWR